MVCMHIPNSPDHLPAHPVAPYSRGDRASTLRITRRSISSCSHRRSSCSISLNKAGALARLEEEDRDLAEVEVDEVLGLVGHVGAEVTADNRVPGRVVLLVEFLLAVGSDIFLDGVLLQGDGGIRQE